jgi:hypothetical protein
MEKKKGRPPVKNLTVTEVCEIILCCAHNNVSHFSYFGLAFKLHPHENSVVRQNNCTIDDSDGVDFADEENSALKVSELILRDEQVKNLIIEDPEAFEEMLARDELVDEDES